MGGSVGVRIPVYPRHPPNFTGPASTAILAGAFLRPPACPSWYDELTATSQVVDPRPGARGASAPRSRLPARAHSLGWRTAARSTGGNRRALLPMCQDRKCFIGRVTAPEKSL